MSHDREFLDQLCTKIVETEFGKATTYKGNYTQYVSAKAEKLAQQWAAYEKQQKEIARQVGLDVLAAVRAERILADLAGLLAGRERQHLREQRVIGR